MAIRRAGSCAREASYAIVLVDPDPVELSNLCRQVIYREVDIGLPKVEAAVRRLACAAAESAIEAHRCALDTSNAVDLIAACDFVIDATDNPAAKFLINDTCIAAQRPFAYGGVIGMKGQAMTVIPSRTACLRCLFEEPPDEAEIASCREAGIVGPVAGAIGEVQAAQALQWLAGAAHARGKDPDLRRRRERDRKPNANHAGRAACRMPMRRRSRRRLNARVAPQAPTELPLPDKGEAGERCVRRVRVR